MTDITWRRTDDPDVFDETRVTEKTRDIKKIRAQLAVVTTELAGLPQTKDGADTETLAAWNDAITNNAANTRQQITRLQADKTALPHLKDRPDEETLRTYNDPITAQGDAIDTQIAELQAELGGLPGTKSSPDAETLEKWNKYATGIRARPQGQKTSYENYITEITSKAIARG